MRVSPILIVMLLCLLVSAPAGANPMPWETRTEAVQAQPVAKPGTPEWNAIFPPGFTFVIPNSRSRVQRLNEKQAIKFERFDRLRVRSDGTAANEIDYLTNVTEALLTISTDDILRYAREPEVKVNYEERLRFFLGPAWTPYELYLTTQKNRLSAQLPSSGRMRAAGLRVTAELTPATRHLTFANGRGTFAAEGWLSDGVYGMGTRSQAFLLKLDFITDKASPDIIITKWDMTIKDKK